MWGVDHLRWPSVIGVEAYTSARDAFHWTYSVAYTNLIEADACCGPNPTLTYRHRVFLPSAGIAYDFPLRALRLRVQGAAGPYFVQQSRTGTPPPGVGARETEWRTGFLTTKIGASLLYESPGGIGGVVGVHQFSEYGLGGGLSGGQVVPYLGVSWRLSTKRPSRPLTIDSVIPLAPPPETPEPPPVIRRAREDALARVFMGPEPGRILRLSAADTTVTGRFLGQRQDTVFITGNGYTFAASHANIDSVSLRTRRLGLSTLNGALIGAFVFGGLAAIAFDTGCDYCFDNKMTAAAVFALPGAAAGAIIGHAIGWMSRPWRRLYP